MPSGPLGSASDRGTEGVWGQTLLDFMSSDVVTKIYEYHGLMRANPESRLCSTLDYAVC